MDLYQIDVEYLRLLGKESYTEEDLNQIDLLSSNEREKSIILASYIRNVTLELAGVIDAIKAMKARSDRLAKKIDDLSKMVLDKMTVINADEITDSPHFEIKVYKNPPRVDVYDSSEVPESFWKEKVQRWVCLDDVKHAITFHGLEVPGARIVQDKRLSIK